MKKENAKNFFIAFCAFISFVLWTILVLFVDLKAIGPCGSAVGLATLNQYFHKLTGVNLTLYIITDWLSLIPIGISASFAILGLTQWIKRKSLKKVDTDIFILGGFYILTIAAYLFFEKVVINYRPILINGYLEASYPSSTTLLVICVMSTALMQFNSRIKNTLLKKYLSFAIIVFIAFMIIGRLISGVHWLSDIIGGGLLSTTFVMTYRSLSV